MEKVEAEEWEGAGEREELLGNKEEGKGRKRKVSRRKGRGRKWEEEWRERAGEGKAPGVAPPSAGGQQGEDTFPQGSVHFLAWKDVQYLCS